jgi:hemerythrin
MMKSAACESFTWHKQQHDAVRKKAKEFLREFARGDQAVPEAFLSYLARWLRDHMAVSDRLMGAQVRNRVRRAASAS